MSGPGQRFFHARPTGAHHASTHREPLAMDDLHNAWLIALALGIPLGLAINEAGQHIANWWNENRPPPPDAPHHYPGAR